jgi:hypothetical protein
MISIDFKLIVCLFIASMVVKVPPMADSITEGALGSWEKRNDDIL